MAAMAAMRGGPLVFSPPRGAEKKPTTSASEAHENSSLLRCAERPANQPAMAAMAAMRGGPPMASASSCHGGISAASTSSSRRRRRRRSVSVCRIQRQMLPSGVPANWARAARQDRVGISPERGLISFCGMSRGEGGGMLCGSALFSSGLRGSRSLPGFYEGEGRRMVGSSSRNVVAQAKNNGIEAPERVLAALGYILPFFDGIQYGRYFFLQYPAAENFLRPLYPLLAAYKGFPYSNFIAFFSLYLLVVRNQSVSRYVRFNAMQAVVLDVLLILPTLVERTFAPRGGVGFQLLIIFYNTVFLFLVACFLFGVVSCILGKTPRLPIVADAADAQV